MVQQMRHKTWLHFYMDRYASNITQN